MGSRKGALLTAVLLAAVFTYQQKALRQLRAENAALRASVEAAQQAPAQTNIVVADTNRAAAEHEELLRLRGQVAQLRREKDELARKGAAPQPLPTNPAPATPIPQADPKTAWVQEILSAPLAQQGATLGSIRAKLLRGEALTPEEIALRDTMAQRQLNSLERSPNEFADFQTAYIQNLLGLSDAERSKQIHGIIHRTYEHAVANGLDVPSKPAQGADAWVDQRHNLDRRATSAVQGLLTPEERQVFDRAFIGVMGIDIGTGVDKSNYPAGFLGD